MRDSALHIIWDDKNKSKNPSSDFERGDIYFGGMRHEHILCSMTGVSRKHWYSTYSCVRLEWRNIIHLFTDICYSEIVNL